MDFSVMHDPKNNAYDNFVLHCSENIEYEPRDGCYRVTLIPSRIGDISRSTFRATLHSTFQNSYLNIPELLAPELTGPVCHCTF